ncbi:MAG: acyl-CoA dehydrogenase [SAR324 cluster bacterium]|nr:acyl-CoA dehydrogenase [SAR324 cluster bacterium]
MRLNGFVDTTHPLSLRSAFKKLDPKVRPLIDYAPESLWEQDTAMLPLPLRQHRKQCRKFAETWLKPHVLEFDSCHDKPDVWPIMKTAARHGLFTDMPAPIGTLNILKSVYPLQWVQSIKLEELCTVCGGLGLLLGAHVLGSAPLVLSGSISAIRQFLWPMYQQNKQGEPALMAFAITEPGAGSDAEDGDGAFHYRPGTVAGKVQGGWMINGRKIFISGGDRASAVCVFAALEHEGMESWTCFLVKKDTPGFSVGRNELKMGQRASTASELIFEDVFVPDSHVIGKLRSGWALNRAVLNFSRIPVGAIALGIARGAMESAIQFVCTQTLGGKPLMEYQEVQLNVAQMLIDTSAMRAMIWQSASTFTPTQARASMTKVFCGDMAVKVCEAAMEIMGNHGMLHTKLAEKAYRDSRLTQIYEGTNQINRLAVIEDQMEEFCRYYQS